MTHIKTEQETDYNFAEYCPRCDTNVPIVIDDDDDKTYSVICPNCGRKLMLCTLCHWDADDAGYDERCDWCEERGCWRERDDKPWWKTKQFTVGTETDCYLETGTYGNFHIYVGISSESEGYMFDLTVNLPETDQYPKHFGFVDTNNFPGATELIRRLRIGKFTGRTAMSGFCIYPLYEFDEKALKEWAEGAPK